MEQFPLDIISLCTFKIKAFSVQIMYFQQIEDGKAQNNYASYKKEKALCDV